MIVFDINKNINKIINIDTNEKFSKKEIEKIVDQLSFSKFGELECLMPITTQTNEVQIQKYKIELLICPLCPTNRANTNRSIGSFIKVTSVL